jgi:hypothetical protein
MLRRLLLQIPAIAYPIIAALGLALDLLLSHIYPDL